MNALMLMAVLAATPRLAIPEFTGVNLAPNEAGLYANSLAAELLRNGLTVVTNRELVALIGVERQKQLTGCSESSCLTELIGALGADGLLLGDIGKLEAGYVVQLKVLSTQSGQVLALFSGKAKDSSAVLPLLEAAAIDLQNQLADKWGRPELRRAVPVVAPPPPPPPNLRWVSYVVGGAGIASLAAGVALNLQADSTLQQLRSSGTMATPQSLLALRDSGRSAEALGITFLGVGAAALTTSVILFFALAPQTPVAALVPLPGGGAVSLMGVWP